MPLFTKENAATLGRKGGLARWTKPPSQPLPIASSSVQAEPEAYPDAIARVRSKMDKLDRMMDEADESREWDNLSRAYDRLFKCWAWMVGKAGPGNRKPAPERHQAPRSTAPRMLDEPACGVDTPMGSVRTTSQDVPDTTSAEVSI